MPPQMEILVHISGPSRGSDDERYRREARGLLNFEALHTHAISRDLVKARGSSAQESIELSTCFPSDPLQHEADPRSGQTPSPLSGELARTRGTLLTELEATTPAHVSTLKRPLETPAAANAAVASPVQPWTGVKETPRLLVERTPFPPRPRTAPETNVASCAATSKGLQPLRRTQSDSWQTPPSVVPDSQPQQSSSDEYRTASSPILPSKRAFFQSSPPSPDKPFSSLPAKRARRSSPSPPSTNPLDDLSSGSLTPTTGSSSQEQQSLPLPTLLSPTQRRSRQTLPSSRPPSKDTPHHDEDDDDRPSSPLPLAQLLPSSSQDNIPPTASPSTTLSDLPLLIEPPRPPVGNGTFTTHLTKHLYVLFKMAGLQRHKVPASAFRRPVAKLERGHWRVPLGAMDERCKVKLWRYLMEYVGEGKAGWGVRCARETIPPAKEASSGGPRRGRGGGSDKENVTPGGGDELERTVDVALIYCWGEVIEHVWLVLFLAGKHRVRGVGARWIDSAGQVVVEAE